MSPSASTLREASPAETSTPRDVAGTSAARHAARGAKIPVSRPLRDRYRERRRGVARRVLGLPTIMQDMTARPLTHDGSALPYFVPPGISFHMSRESFQVPSLWRFHVTTYLIR